MIKLVIPLVIGFVFGGALINDLEKKESFIENESVISILERLRDDFSDKKVDYNIKGVSVEAGEKLVHQGFAIKTDGGKTKRQSKHFVCTSCHNVVREDPDLSVTDPQARLEYTSANNVPYLQGSTLYGAVNRTSYYNGDYEKKYGDLVKPARNDIREAINLCAVECAQGRKLKDWETESILAYLWTLELKVEDLLINGEELDLIMLALEGKYSRTKAKDLIKSKFKEDSPAHFVPPPEDRKAGIALEGNPDNGKLIYENGCLHCHYQQRYSYFALDNSKLSFRHLNGKAEKYSRHSIYQVIRWGVPSYSGKRSYMPQYTMEKMSDQQLADLRSYIRQQAK